jgi:hypothetical protein
MLVGAAMEIQSGKQFNQPVAVVGLSLLLEEEGGRAPLHGRLAEHDFTAGV